jgi:hypothetical protein
VETVQQFDSIFEYLGSLKRLLTPDETAEILGMTRERLNMIRITGQPEIPFIKTTNRDCRYDPGALAAYLRKRTAVNTGVSNQFDDVDTNGTQAARRATKRGRPAQ